MGADEDTCVDYAEGATAVGCMLDGMGCAEVITYASPPDADLGRDGCMMFMSTCLPLGWEECGGVFGDEACPEDEVPAECEGAFAEGGGPSCCVSSDSGADPTGSHATCDDGTWDCGTDAVCECGEEGPALYDCVYDCEAEMPAAEAFCVYGDHWECPVSTIPRTECP